MREIIGGIRSWIAQRHPQLHILQLCLLQIPGKELLLHRLEGPYKIHIERMIIKNNLSFYFIFSFFQFVKITNQNHWCSDTARFC